MAGPTDTVRELVEAINRGELERALMTYEPGAVLLVQPDKIVRGSDQLRQAVAGFIALKPILETEAQEVVEAGDVALYVGRWSLRGTDPAGQPVAMEGESSDILRRQEDGRWLIALDNPWGARILKARE